MKEAVENMFETGGEVGFHPALTFAIFLCLLPLLVILGIFMLLLKSAISCAFFAAVFSILFKLGAGILTPGATVFHWASVGALAGLGVSAIDSIVKSSKS